MQANRCALVLALILAPLTANAAGMDGRQVASGGRFVLSQGGRTIASFQELKGISSAVGPAEYLYNDAGTGTVQHTKQFGMQKAPTVTLMRGLNPGNELWNWHERARTGAPDARKQLTLEMTGAAGRSITYRLNNCWVTKLEVGGLRAGGSGPVQTVQLECDSIQAAR